MRIQTIFQYSSDFLSHVLTLLFGDFRVPSDSIDVEFRSLNFHLKGGQTIQIDVMWALFRAAIISDGGVLPPNLLPQVGR